MVTMKRLHICCLAIGILFLLSWSRAWAEDTFIDGFTIQRNNGILAVSFFVQNCFNEKMEEAIRAGVPTTFNFFVHLRKPRFLIWDKKIAKHKFTHTVAYDNIQKDYKVTLQESGKEIRADTLEAAKEQMARVDSFPVVAHGVLDGGRYRLDIKAELDPVKLPLRMEFVLFFVSLWDFETDWYHHTFDVLP
jgi:hypothetical protein